MPHQVVRWILMTIAIVIAIYLYRPRRKPPDPERVLNTFGDHALGPYCRPQPD
jgi:hypothetical protein